jgi:hypothetical protein
MHSKQVITVSDRLTGHAIIVTSIGACKCCLGRNMCAMCLLPDNYEPKTGHIGSTGDIPSICVGLDCTHLIG